MTATERAEEKRIERDIALAALTPDLGDDTSRAQELVGFLSKVLGEAQAEPGPRGGDEGIKQVAEALKSAQNNLASLTSPGGGATNDNSDLQAQLDQAQANLASSKAAETNSKTNYQREVVLVRKADDSQANLDTAKASYDQTAAAALGSQGDRSNLRRDDRCHCHRQRSTDLHVQPSGLQQHRRTRRGRYTGPQRA